MRSMMQRKHTSSIKIVAYFCYIHQTFIVSLNTSGIGATKQKNAEMDQDLVANKSNFTPLYKNVIAQMIQDI